MIFSRRGAFRGPPAQQSEGRLHFPAFGLLSAGHRSAQGSYCPMSPMRRMMSSMASAFAGVMGVSGIRGGPAW